MNDRIFYKEKILSEVKVGEDDRVKVIGTIVNLDLENSSFDLDDSFGRTTVIVKDVELMKGLEVGKFVRVFGRVVGYEGGFEIIADIIQDMSNLNMEIWKEYIELVKGK